MSLNIKDEQVHDLVRQAARRAGLSQTRVVARAIEEFLARMEAEDEREARRRRLDALWERWQREPLTEEEKAAMRQVEESLYDPETGLPA
ncbi:MAG: type II toxin-antitoxin system VapB family antitoxin [Nocardioidaceae bacterium]|nr:type II toxin-antitoxin system VapB family antitoxin [Nocardioidaceae bacterium]